MHLPAPLRAAVGLAATAADEARRLPDRALELPMLAVSTALQASVRAQQRYARLTARGDAVLNRTHPTDEPPAWATFDAPLSDDELRRAPSRFDTVDSLPGDSAADTARLVGELISPDGADDADSDVEEQAQNALNDALPAEPGADPANGYPAPATPLARTQPRQPPARKTAPAPEESSGLTPDSEPADS